MATKTAVEWLIERLINRQNGVFDDFSFMSLDELYEQAKAMEKEQIMVAYKSNAYGFESDQFVEQYYNETYRS